MPPDLQLKAPQPHPQSPGQVQTPKSGSNHVANPAVKLVSGRQRCRSHSPCRRIDVEIEPSYEERQWKDVRQAISSDNLMVPSDWDVTAFDPVDTFSCSLPENAFHLALPRQRNSYSSASDSGNLLQVPDNSHFPRSCTHSCDGSWQLAIRGSFNSMCNLSASAPVGTLRQNLDERYQRSSYYHDNLVFSPPQSPTPAWLCLSPRTSPQSSRSHSPGISSSCSISSVSSPCSPIDIEFYMAHESSPSRHTHLLSPNQASNPILIPPFSTPHPLYGSPFGSQTQISKRSLGTEC